MNFDIDPRDINLQGPDGMQLVKLLRGLIEEIDSGGDVPVPVVDSEIFYCTYNQTSGAEISQALSNGLLPICKYNTKVYYLVSTVPPYAFVSFDRTNFNMYLLTCIGTTWSMPIRYLQERLEFDYTPTQGSTNPVTSGGVYTAIQQGGGGSDIDPYQQYPSMDGTASPGSSDDYARGDHVHPTDTSRAAASEITRIDAALATKADAATMEQEIEDAVDDWLSVQAPSIGTLSYAAKQALLACFRHVAWIDVQGQSYYNALESELFPDATLASISAVFTQGSAVIYDTDSLDTLRQYLVVTATFSDSTTETVTGYELSGTLTAGTSTITVSYGGKTTTFSAAVTPWDISWDYTDGLPENNGFTKTYTNGTANMTSNGLECSGSSLAWTPNNEQTATTTIFETVFIPEILSSQNSANGNGFKLAVFNGSRAMTVGVNSQGVCYYDAARSGYSVATSNISTNTEYLLRIETGQSEGKIYLDGELVSTVALASTSTTNSRVFGGASAGSGKTLIKAIRYDYVT